MTKYTVAVDGMQCGMCEAHVNDAIRKAFTVKKVTSSHSKKQTVVITEQPIDEQALKKVIDDTGYTAVSVSVSPMRKGACFTGNGELDLQGLPPWEAFLFALEVVLQHTTKNTILRKNRQKVSTCI